MKPRDAAGPDFRALVERIPTEFIRDAPQGKYGKYVSHSDIAQIALARLGRPHDYEVREVVRGLIPPSETGSGKAYPERPNGVVGVLARLTVRIDDETYTVTEAGEANSPHTSWDWENLKTATSDAYKRCWMRLGVGLELWIEQGASRSTYWLDTVFNPREGGKE